MRCLTLVVIILLGIVALPAMSSPGYLGGYSGTIYVPDGSITPHGEYYISFHDSISVLDTDSHNDIRAIGLQYGLSRRMEFGSSYIQNDVTKVAFNAKYRLIDETNRWPLLAIGVFDLGGQVDFLDNSPAFYILASKDLTPVATHLEGSPSKPIRVTAGIGTGIFNGLLASLDWTLYPRFSLQFEYFGGHVGDESHLYNAGVKYGLTKVLSLDAGTINFEHFAFGANLRTTFR